MAATPDDELADAVAALAEWGSLTRRLDSARLRAKESAAKAESVRDRVRDEARDVEKLESMSFTSILAHLRGSHADDLARETAEHQAAEYEYLTQRARADADQRVVDTYQAQLTALGDVKARHTRALAAKEKWLLERNDPVAPRLCEIAERRGVLEAALVEIGQAMDAGESALEQLSWASEELDSARSWSAYDTWFDGGMITSAVKHDKLDGAAVHMRRADSALKRFATELADVNMAGMRDLDMGDFTRAFDVWFDNLFTDLAVRRRIIDAQEKVAETISGVKVLLAQLRSRRQRCVDEVARLHSERAGLLES